MPASPPITVAIARFEDLLELGLLALLAEDPSVSVVAHDIAYDRIDVVLRAHRPRVLILDVGGLSELARVRVLTVDHPTTVLVLLGQSFSSAESAQLLAFGASACLTKDTQARDVRHAIHLASRGLQVMPLGDGRDGAPMRDARLTRREGDILLLLRQSSSNAQIALTLQIGIETVRTHARSIYRKLGISSRRELSQPATPRAAATASVPAPRHRAGSRPVPRRSRR